MSEVFIPKLNPNYYIFPKEASDEGIVAWGGDLKPDRLIAAYKSGVFPWYNEDDPILWWSPNPRCVLFPKDVKISKSLKKSMRKYKVTYDRDFLNVIRMCRQIRVKSGEETWIVEDMIKAYEALHVRDFAHSVEVWDGEELVGGLYGICMGRVFCGESMFSKKRDASKVAFVNLAQKLQSYNFDMIDCQVPNSHLLSLGASVISKDEFLQILEKSVEKPSGFEKFADI